MPITITSKKLYFVLVVSFALFVMNYVATAANLYWTTSWADVIAHTLGGALVGGIVIAVMTARAIYNKPLAWIIFFALVVGVVWELFELYTGMTFVTDPGYFFDTPKDIFFDTVGAIMSYLYFKPSTH